MGYVYRERREREREIITTFNCSYTLYACIHSMNTCSPFIFTFAVLTFSSAHGRLWWVLVLGNLSCIVCCQTYGEPHSLQLWGWPVTMCGFICGHIAQTQQGGSEALPQSLTQTQLCLAPDIFLFLISNYKPYANGQLCAFHSLFIEPPFHCSPFPFSMAVCLHSLSILCPVCQIHVEKE